MDSPESQEESDIIYTYAYELRRIADNDYMINQHYLPDGKLLLKIAYYLESNLEQTNEPN